MIRNAADEFTLFTVIYVVLSCTRVAFIVSWLAVISMVVNIHYNYDLPENFQCSVVLKARLLPAVDKRRHSCEPDSICDIRKFKYCYSL